MQLVNLGQSVGARISGLPPRIAGFGRLRNALGFTSSQHKVVAPVNVCDFSADTQYFVSYIGRPIYKGAFSAHAITCKRAFTNLQHGTHFLLFRNGTKFQPQIFIQNHNGDQYIVATCSNLFDYGAYYHIVGVYGGLSSSGWNIYVNGVIQPLTFTLSGTLTALSIIQTTEKFCVGNYNELNNNFLDPHYYHFGQIASIYIGLGIPSQSDVNLMYKHENSLITTNTYLFYRFLEKKGITLADSFAGRDGILLNYTNSETASAGQPQSGNTAWLNAYPLQPITT